MRLIFTASAILIVATAMGAGAQTESLGRSDEAGAGDFGAIGLLRTPTARTMGAGTIELGGFAQESYRGFYVRAHPFEWLEANFRFTDITNVQEDGTVLPLGQVDFLEDLFGFKGGGTITDRAFDLKIRLLQEGDFLPAIAVGFSDMFGDARFGGEYIVANKRFGAFDFSFGLGWGYLGSRNHVGNPFGLISNSFDRRGSANSRGSFNIGNYFSGDDIAFFGGVSWQTPIHGLSMLVEYSGSDPEFEPLGNRFDEDFPVNFGMRYRPFPWLDMGLGFERGNTVSARTAIRFDLFDLPGMFDRPKSWKPHPPVTAQQSEDAGEDSQTVSQDGPNPEIAIGQILAGLGFDGALVRGDAQAVYVDLPLNTKGAEKGLSEAGVAAHILAYLPDTVNRLWLVWRGERLSEARLYIPNDASALQARAVMALADMGTVSEITLKDGEAVFHPSGGEGITLLDSVALDDALLVALPSDMGAVRLAKPAHHGEAAQSGETMLDLHAVRALAQASHMLDAAGGSLVTGLSIKGQHAAHLQVDQADTTGIDGAELAERVKVAQAVVSAAGYDNRDVLERKAGLLFEKLEANGHRPRALAWHNGRMTLWLDDAPTDREMQLVGQVARQVSGFAGAQVEAIAVRRSLGSHDILETRILRRDLVNALEGRGSPEELWITAKVEMEPDSTAVDGTFIANDNAYPAFQWGVAPVVIQQVGDSKSGAWLADLNVDLLASLDLMPGLQLSGAVRRFIGGNLDQIGQVSEASDLPVVRSDIRDFIEEGRTAIPYLQADWRGGLGENLYGRLSAGIFEQMFGGLSLEMLYRTPDTAGLWAAN
ncbi:hypothetical protein JCM17844_24430 [Iodidimonas gelatinilytica]|uniref:YjbH domain-containing protein n=1 Tax=Iodidimonas gelatinilytica TaxID=1236966 RepID=A0A5A7MSL9_9PROT|nr:YjbH domain-containing protein [Iodidimonas gelatinilytica]GEQ98806.1 hypothetical protein JCM17844_24430 [Iodidimonas gelatinilytica]